MMFRGPVWLSLLALALTGSVRGQDGESVAGSTQGSADTAPMEFFEEQVRPVLADNCIDCHGPDKQKGGLRLDSLSAMLQGGDSGPAVVPGKAEESLLVEVIHPGGFFEMPPRGKLEVTQVEALTRWVEAGAHWPGSEDTGTAPKSAAEASKLTDEDRAFWSFQPLRPVEPPEHPSDDWSRNPIDHFIFERLLSENLTPSPEADRATLIRRVTFDLTGLPPTPDEVRSFLEDPSPNAYESMVDRLLASPHYGERWGRHWLDLVRYAESDGHRADAYRPNAWTYRDYVIQSFNDDKPYDQFVREQLAGDELHPGDPEMRVATMYYRHGPYEYNQRDVPRQRADILDDITDVTGEVFLGLSIGCARCHDHKFDPILQSDYYRLQAFFTPLSWRDDLPLATDQKVADYHIQKAAWELLTAEVRDQLAEIEHPYREAAALDAITKFPEEMQDLLARPRQELSISERQLYDLAFRQVQYEWDNIEKRIKGDDKTQYEELKSQLARFDPYKPKPLPPSYTATDIGPIAPPTTIPGKRDAEPLDPGFLTVLGGEPLVIETPAECPNSTGRRSALAEWLTRPENPLATRVITNRIWQYHFGRGLVGTSSDFGRLGEVPSHPELLDWLSARFLADGWSFKALHRLILNSATYRQASLVAASEAVNQIDPENRLLWRFNPRRLDAEEIRDAILAVSGEIDLGSGGGPSVDHENPRRTIYCKVVRNSRDELLDAFDAPDNFLSTAARNLTVTPSQALLLINGEWSLERARAFADRLVQAEPENAAARITLAYRLAFARDPGTRELADAATFLEHQRELVRRQGRQGNEKPSGSDRSEDQALVDFCHALLNANEFLHID